MRKGAPKTTNTERDLKLMEESEKYYEISLWELAKDGQYKRYLEKENLSPEYFQQEGVIQTAIPVPPPELLYTLLYRYGMDVDCNIESQECIHRTWDGHKVYGLRWVGIQRTDKDWKEFLKALGKYQNN